MTDDNLKARVERLEQTVENQAEVIKELLPEDVSPDRRAVLKAGSGALALGLTGGLGYDYGVGKARAATDQVGTSSKRVDVFGDTVDAVTLDARKVDTSSGYSYSDVTSSRSLDTWQTAPSDRDIEFIVRVSASANATRVNLVVDIKSSQTQNSIDRVDLTIDSNDILSIGAYRVPAGFEYQVRAGGDTGSFSLDKWFELK